MADRSVSEMLALSEKGDNSSVDMLVGDIYGQDYGRLGLKSTTIASSFGKVFKKGGQKSNFSAEILPIPSSRLLKDSYKKTI